ncbi:MAG: enoyl-CoA hydratase/isomerase family protein [Syntrophales bacterium]
MEYKTLLVETKTGIGIVWMNRPKLHNALDDTMTAELTAAMRKMDDDPAVRIVILAGTGKSFSAGADMDWLRRLGGFNAKQNRAEALNAATLLQTIDALKKPTIARVHGPAFGGGAGLIAACDMAVAAYEAEFCLSEVRLGAIPAAIGPYVIRAIGERAARRYFLSAERFTAAEAYRIGLVSDLAPLGELDAAINNLLGQLIQGAPHAQALTKDWIRAAAGAPINSALIDDGAARNADVRASEEGREGISSLIEKRRPAWLDQLKKSAPKKAASSKAKSKK